MWEQSTGLWQPLQHVANTHHQHNLTLANRPTLRPTQRARPACTQALHASTHLGKGQHLAHELLAKHDVGAPAAHHLNQLPPHAIQLAQQHGLRG